MHPEKRAKIDPFPFASTKFDSNQMGEVGQNKDEFSSQ